MAYRVGQKITLAVTPFKPCRLTVLEVATNGAIHVLFPSPKAQNAQIQPMQTVIVSGESAPVTLEASGPLGQRHDPAGVATPGVVTAVAALSFHIHP